VRAARSGSPMAREFKLPDLGEGLTEAEIVQVLVHEGDAVAEDQPVLLVETEKAQVELPSPFGGHVARIHVQAGQRVKVGTILLSFGDAEAAGAPPAAAPARPEAAAAAPGRPAVEAAAAATGGTASLAAVPAARPAPAGPPSGTGLLPAATPATRRRARELGVDLATVRGSGPGGRITAADVEAAARGDAVPQAPPAPAGAPGVAPGAGPAAAVEPAVPRSPLGPRELPPLPRFEQWGPVERQPLRGVRRRSAEHLALAWSTIPHVTQHDAADITDLEALRQRHQPRVRAWGGELTLTVLLVKAAAIVLQAHPRFNASLDARAGELVLKRY